jgi:hypothetical protein
MIIPNEASNARAGDRDSPKLGVSRPFRPADLRSAGAERSDSPLPAPLTRQSAPEAEATIPATESPFLERGSRAFSHAAGMPPPGGRARTSRATPQAVYSCRIHSRRPRKPLLKRRPPGPPSGVGGRGRPVSARGDEARAAGSTQRLAPTSARAGDAPGVAGQAQERQYLPASGLHNQPPPRPARARALRPP